MNILQKYSYLALETLVDAQEIGVYGGSDAKLMIFDAGEFRNILKDISNTIMSPVILGQLN